MDLRLVEEILQWDRELKADRLVFDINDKYYQEAKKYGKVLWINPDIRYIPAKKTKDNTKEK